MVSDHHKNVVVIGKRQVIDAYPRSPRSPGLSPMQTPVGSTTLRVLTTDSPKTEPPAPPVCTGGYTCICQDCAPTLERRVQRGVRPDRSNPIRKAA